MHPLLNIQDLSVQFTSGNNTTRALESVNISVSRGEIVALVGESGSGKSVTSLSILRLVPAPPVSYPSGKILFSENGTDNVDLLHCSDKELRRIRGNRISMIFQEPMSSLNPVYTCGDQVAEALRSHRSMSAAEAKARTIEWFTRVQLPDPAGIYDRYPHQVSGGQKQRVMIAMAMCCEPALLICDEPTTALDVTVQQNILRIIRELQRETGMGVIFITHDLGVVAEIADRVVVLYRGSIVEQNTTAHIFVEPRHPYTRGLLACRPILHRKGERLPVVSDYWDGSDEGMTTRVAGEKVNAQVASMAVEGPSTGYESESVKRETLITVDHLSVSFPSKKNLFGRTLTWNKAVDDVSFEVYRNETLGLVGESGCGKTTLGRALLRLIEPTSGTILYKEQDLAGVSAAGMTRLRQHVQIIFQDPYSSLNPRMTVGAAILEPLEFHGLYVNNKTRRERVCGLLGKVGLLPEHYHRYPHEFSGGQRQRIVIARALAMQPDFIVCDESVSALDVSVQAQILNLLNDLRREFGFTVIFISHDLSVVRYISDRIMVMNRGRIEETGSAEEVWNAPKSAYTKRLIDSIPKGFETGANAEPR